MCKIKILKFLFTKINVTTPKSLIWILEFRTLINLRAQWQSAHWKHRTVLLWEVFALKIADSNSRHFKFSRTRHQQPTHGAQFRDAFPRSERDSVWCFPWRKLFVAKLFRLRLLTLCLFFLLQTQRSRHKTAGVGWIARVGRIFRIMLAKFQFFILPQRIASNFAKFFKFSCHQTVYIIETLFMSRVQRFRYLDINNVKNKITDTILIV